MSKEIKDTGLIAIELQVEARAVEGNERCYDFVISTEDLDMHNTVFRADGLSLERYSKNPVVTFGHPSLNTTDPDVVIGTSTISRDGKKTIARLQLEPKGDNPLADKIEKKLQNGTLRMASIRAQVISAEWIEAGDDYIREYTEWELIDWGVVIHGSNPSAIMRSMEDATQHLLGDKPNKEKSVDHTLELKSRAMEMKMKRRKRLKVS